MSKGIKNKQIQIVLDILQNEVDGNTKEAIKKMHPDYTNTYMTNLFNKLFHGTKVNNRDELEDVYQIKGRKYEIYNIVSLGNCVMVEMVESYPDPETGKIYKTPQVIVSEFEDGLIKTGRHYNDPSVSFMDLTKEEINEAYKNKKALYIIE